jgi:hypothetical protein
MKSTCKALTIAGSDSGAGGEGHICVTNLPAAPEGKMYVVRTIAQGSAPRYVGTIKTDAVGQGGLHLNTARTDYLVETFAVTLKAARHKR